MKTQTRWAHSIAPVLAVGAFLTVQAQAQSMDAAPSSTMAEVVVSASRYAEPEKVLPYGVSVITADDIRSAGVSSVSEAIMKILGVPGTLDLSGGNNYAVDLRGFGSTSISNQIVIVDGTRLNDDELASPNLSAVPIEAVDRIEIMRGVGAVQYGAGATGGVIVITTKAGNGLVRHNSAVLSAEVGSNGLVDERGSVTLVAGDFSLDAARQDRRSDGNRDNFASDNNSTSVTGQWSSNGVRLGFKGGNSSMQSGLPGSLTAAQFTSNPSQTVTPYDWGMMSSTNDGVFAEATLGNWKVNFDADQHTKQAVSGVTYYGDTSPSYYGESVNANSQNLRARNERQWGQIDNAFVIGVDQSQWTRNILPLSGYTSVAQSNANAWYFTDDISLASKTRFSIGFRNEGETKSDSSSETQVSNNENAWLLGVNQALDAHWNIYAHTGESFRLANADEFSYTNPAVQIQPQTSHDNEIGVRWNTLMHQVELRWFRSDLTNEIGYDPNANSPSGPSYPGANVNFDPTVHQGVELESKHALSADVDVRVNASVKEAKFVSGPYAGNDIPMVPGQSVALGADWRVAAGQSVGAGLLWVSQQSVDFENTCFIPAYTTLDTRYAYVHKNIEFAVAVKNLTDAQYYTQAYSTSSQPCTPGGVSNAIYPEAGRTVSASLRVAF